MNSKGEKAREVEKGRILIEYQYSFPPVTRIMEEKREGRGEGKSVSGGPSIIYASFSNNQEIMKSSPLGFPVEFIPPTTANR